ncbi:cytochrome P450 [Cyathus striatus]|nr:cytochrome P450 [Cyathus striatus]
MMNSIFYDPFAMLLAAIAVSSLLIMYRNETRKLRHIPTVGYNSPILSYISAIKFLFKGVDVIQEGYDKHKGGMFKIPLLQSWIVLVSGDELVGELKTAPDRLFSAGLATDELLQIPYTMGSEITTNPYHVSIVRTRLTRNLANIFPAVRDELLASFSEIIPEKEGWVKYNASDAFMKIIARVTNRMIVGFPLCRDEEFLDNAVQYTMDVIIVSTIINLVPPFLRPLSTYIFRSVSNRIKCAQTLLEPVIERHRKELAERTNDNELIFLNWLLSEAKGEEQENIKLARRIMLVNFGAIHTTSITFLQALYCLAANPSYIQPLREEVEEVVSQDGWSKASLDKLLKVDSFIREAQRLHSPGGFTAMRKALVDYTFRNGTYIPKNTMLAVPLEPVHIDPDVYPNAYEFDGFRFAKINEANGNRKADIVSLGDNFLTFGLGKHACPGRFFASNELKLLLSHVVVNYDVKFENEGIRPDDVFLGPSRNPNPNAEVMFRRRVNKL